LENEVQQFKNQEPSLSIKNNDFAQQDSWNFRKYPQLPDSLLLSDGNQFSLDQ
jgi:hypothetical protein